MAVTKKQAIGMMHKKYREAVRRSRNKKNADFTEHLYQITLDKAYLETLHVKCFSAADESWLDFVLMCREKGGVPHDYDVVIGPTADDDAFPIPLVRSRAWSLMPWFRKVSPSRAEAYRTKSRTSDSG